jgi:hypothetical protein
MKRVGAHNRPWGRSGGPGILAVMGAVPIAVLLVSAATLIGSGHALRKNATAVLQRVVHPSTEGRRP